MAFEITTVAAMADARALETTIDQLMQLVDQVLDSAIGTEFCPI